MFIFEFAHSRSCFSLLFRFGIQPFSFSTVVKGHRRLTLLRRSHDKPTLVGMNAAFENHSVGGVLIYRLLPQEHERLGLYLSATGLIISSWSTTPQLLKVKVDPSAVLQKNKPTCETSRVEKEQKKLVIFLPPLRE